jgi:hypothetical protein
VRDQFDDREFP